jgi:hypothetical protein
MNDDSYKITVERLRDITRNRRAVAANLRSQLSQSDAETLGARADVTNLHTEIVLPDAEALEAQVEATVRVMRPMEAAAIRAVADVYLPAGNYPGVVRAIKDADAAWLYPVILNWALESLPAEGDDDGAP